MGGQIKTAGMIGRGRAAPHRALGIILFLHLSIAPSLLYASSLPAENSFCFGCHGDRTLALYLQSGEKRSLYVDSELLARSIHGSRLICTDCHRDIQTYPHPKRAFTNLREFTLAYYESCKGCHFDNYARSLDGVHYTVFSKGNLKAPLCVDCHGAHDVTSPGAPKTRISKTCSRCHDDVYREYAESAHGKALLQEGNVDVPVCTDCHRSHNIEDPRTVSFHLKSPALCAGCHTDPVLMGKYGLPVSAHRTYLADFHGHSVSFAGATRAGAGVISVVCTDCHGVHRIVPVKDPERIAMRANVMKSCGACHGDDVRTVPVDWLSHYEPRPDRAPRVYAVRLFYRFFIPILVVGLVVQILLHVWRVVVNR